ncbi:hypothetical protein JXA12_04195 [Candidatus Woesearchaeota archaeon]|nr:hypothetical protein [Candidatus Woesearchaeota archaeon]
MRIPDRALLAISLGVSALGIGGLAVLFACAEVPEASILEANGLEDGAGVTITGEIVSVRQGAATTHFTIAQTCTIDAVAFENVSLAPGMTVTVTGEMDTYKGERELVVSGIRS